MARMRNRRPSVSASETKLDVNDLGDRNPDVPLNKRVRAVSKAMSRQLINRDGIEAAEEDLRLWLQASA